MPHESTADIHTLVALFYDRPDELGTFSAVASGDMPAKYQRLLAHEDHMTVTVESFHRSPVDVDVRQTTEDGDHYARKILLRRQSDGRVVQFGIVRLNRAFLSEEVREEIESQEIPLGRVLISHNVLRHVQLLSLWKIAAGSDLAGFFEIDVHSEVFGRTALIYCNGEPAVELLEIVSPID